MKIELHLHTSRHSACAQNSPSEMMAGLVSAGYQAVFITEHEALWDEHELDELRREFPTLRIFPGVELALGDNKQQHLLVLGGSDRAFLAIRDIAEILELARQRSLTTILAHPYRWAGGSDMLEQGQLPDAIEYRTNNQQDAQACLLSQQTAGRLGLPLVNAGDSHSLAMLDKFWIETDEPLDDPLALRAVLAAGSYRLCAAT